MDFYSTICRICEISDKICDKWSYLFERGNDHICMKLRSCANVTVDADDKLPKRICNTCKNNLESAYNFKLQCEISESKMRYEISFLEKNDGNSNVPIPPFSYNQLTVKDENETSNGEVHVKSEIMDHFSDENYFGNIECKTIVSEGTSKVNLNPKHEDYDEDDDDEDDDNQGDFINDDDESGSENDPEGTDDESDDDEVLADLKEQSKKSLKRSRVKRHDNDEDGEAKSNEKKRFICETCSEEFQKVSELYKHSRTVHGKNRFQCKECQKWFSRKSRLLNHQLLHAGVRQFECTQCPRKYATMQGLKIHIEDIHTDDHPFVCDKCGKGFAKESKLRHHYSIHIEVRNFTCDICFKTFKTQSHLNLHMNTHAPPDQKKARKRRNRAKVCICPYCGKVSNSTGTHSMHIRTHTGEQPYQCHICEKRFTSSGSHKKHLRVHSGEKPFQCEVCMKQFRQRHHLTTHMRGVHTQEKPYKCLLCEKAFATRGNLTLHMRSHTGETVIKMEQHPHPSTNTLGGNLSLPIIPSAPLPIATQEFLFQHGHMAM